LTTQNTNVTRGTLLKASVWRRPLVRSQRYTSDFSVGQPVL
jgi:hypothetical protein